MPRIAMLDETGKVANIVLGPNATPTTEVVLDATDTVTRIGLQMPPYDANAATIRANVASALAANTTFLALANPTTAQAIAQVKVLTRECNGLIRLLVNKLDSTAGTI